MSYQLDKFQYGLEKLNIDLSQEKLNKFLSDRTGQPLEVINKDTERDNYMTAEEALKYGLIDGIMEKRN